MIKAQVQILIAMTLLTVDLLAQSPVNYDNSVALQRHAQLVKQLKACGNGIDFYDGGPDTDTITFSGSRREYFITSHVDGSFTFRDLVPCRTDTDVLINIEKFSFKEGILELSALNPNKKDSSQSLPATKSKISDNVDGNATLRSRHKSTRVPAQTKPKEVSAEGEKLIFVTQGEIVEHGRILLFSTSEEDEYPVRRKIQLKNVSSSSAGPITVKVGSAIPRLYKGDASIEGWAIDPKSSCLTSQTLPNQNCNLLVKFVPAVDGQYTGIINLLDTPKMGPTHYDYTLYLYGRASGVSGTLPSGVHGVGSLCPQSGSNQEIALSHRGEFAVESGFFKTIGTEKELSTAVCSSWKREKMAIGFEKATCNDAGSSFHKSKLRRYRSKKVTGPWQLTEEKEGYVTVKMYCKNNKIHHLSYTW